MGAAFIGSFANTIFNRKKKGTGFNQTVAETTAKALTDKVSLTAPEAPDFNLDDLNSQFEAIQKEFENFSVQPTQAETITDETVAHDDENNSFDKQRQELQSRQDAVSDQITEGRDQLESRQKEFFDRVSAFRQGLEDQVAGLTRRSAERFSEDVRERGVHSTDINKFRGDRTAKAGERAKKLRDKVNKKGLGRSVVKGILSKIPKKKSGERVNKLGE